VNKLSDFDLNLFALMFAFSVMTIVFSNFMSNTATATILIPIAILLVPDSPIILPLVIGLSASAALFLPISTPPNAIAFSTGRLDQKDFRYGGIIAGLIAPIVIIGIVLIIATYYGYDI
jgi:sodium-dependent dicarboxylate transporter 2/3/5